MTNESNREKKMFLVWYSCLFVSIDLNQSSRANTQTYNIRRSNKFSKKDNKMVIITTLMMCKYNTFEVYFMKKKQRQDNIDDKRLTFKRR